MNIFVTNEDPKVAAQALDDKRVIKMFLESIQMLANAIHDEDLLVRRNLKLELLPRKLDSMPYAKSHFNHPCSIWARESQGNYRWLLDHAKELHEEWCRRKGIPTNCFMYLDNLERLEYASTVLNFAHCVRTPFQNSSADKDGETLSSYRKTMMQKWVFTDRRKPRWTNAKPPKWLKPVYEECVKNIHYMDQPRWPIDTLLS